MLSLGDRTASEFRQGTLIQVYVGGDQGYVILMAVGEETALTVLAHQ